MAAVVAAARGDAKRLAGTVVKAVAAFEVPVELWSRAVARLEAPPSVACPVWDAGGMAGAANGVGEHTAIQSVLCTRSSAPPVRDTPLEAVLATWARRPLPRECRA